VGDTKIPYLTKRWEPVVGCTGEGCACRDTCWARELHNRRHLAYWRDKQVPEQYSRTFEDVQCMPERLDEPLHRRKPTVYGVCFGSDLFGADVPDRFIDRVFASMALCPQHQFVVLTKQAERMATYGLGRPWLMRNLHFGVSVCNQPDADARLPWLARLAAVGWNTWISMEPQHQFVDVSSWIGDAGFGRGIAGVVQGVESGPKRRLAKCQTCYGNPWVDLGRNETVEFGPCPACAGTGYAAWEWARQTRDACEEAGAKFALKQLPDLNGKVLHMPALDRVTHWELPWGVTP